MDFGTHFLTGIILSTVLYLSQSEFWYLAILGSVLPDLIGELVFYLGLWKRKRKFTIFYDKEITNLSKEFSNSYYMIPYNFLHSFLSIILMIILSIPNEFILGHAVHIFIDLLSHSKESWGIMVFWPFSKKRAGPKSNWWEWKQLKGKNLIWFNLINYLIVLTILYAIFALIKNIK